MRYGIARWSSLSFFMCLCLGACSEYKEGPWRSESAHEDAGSREEPARDSFLYPEYCSQAEQVLLCSPPESDACVQKVFVPLSHYCETQPCPSDITSFEAEFLTCAESEFVYQRCPWHRHRGCGFHLYEAVSDESSSLVYVFDLESAQLRGIRVGSDSPNFCGLRGALLVGEAGPRLYGPSACEASIKTHCCASE